MADNRKFIGPVHLDGLMTWGGSSDAPYCPICNKNDKVDWHNGEYKCSRCNHVVEK